MNQIIISKCITTFATAPPKKPMSDPTEASKASFALLFCSISTTMTVKKGMISIPKGGIMKEPTMTAIAALLSPHLLPPNFLTK